MADNPAEYDVKSCAPGDLTDSELSTCAAIIKSGGAVDPHTARTELPRAARLAGARSGGTIVGIGAIKRDRPRYAAGVGKHSGHVFPENSSELGYVAVDPRHQNKGLSKRLAAALLEDRQGLVFATTFDAHMKKTLTRAGFAQKGREWKGNRGKRLSLWIRE